MPSLKVFTWGYDGWGSESSHFVRAVDALERKRGFLPPVFVDLRIARQGRAANFKGDLFRDIVGANRYRWMRKLGNRRIETKRGRRIQIAEPEAAAELLDQIVDLNRGKRRVIMFCACLTPLYRGRLACHRVAVAELLLKRARERNLAIEVSEWPGERPVSVSVNVQGFQEKAIAKGMSISQWDLLRAGYRLWRFWDGDHSSDLKPPNFIGRSLRDLRLCKETSGEFV